MDKHIIALSCSPSRGRNSDSLLDAFIDGVRTIPGVTIEKIYLSDIPIDYYTFENSVGVLPHEEKFGKLCDDIKRANGLVIATPTYNFSVPAHLKNFLDRIRFLALDLDDKNFLGQPTGTFDYLGTYFIVTGGTPSWAEKILFFAFPPFWLRGVFLYYGAKVFGAMYTGDIKAYENKRLLQIAKKRGIYYAKKIKKGARNSLLEQLFWRPPQTDACKKEHSGN